MTGAPADRPTDEEVLAAYPDSGIDRDSLEFYRGLLQRRLLLNRCESCASWHHPPRSLCPRCWSFAVEPTEIDGRGQLSMFTVVHASRPGGSAPVVLATAELRTDGTAREPDPLRFTAPLLGTAGSPPRPGAAVELDWMDGDGGPRPVFRLADRDDVDA